MDVDQSTRVAAPDISYRPCSSPTPRDRVSMTGVTQSLSGDGATPMSALKKIGQSVDLRRRIKFATWNVMTLSGTGYQVVLVHELARLDVPPDLMAFHQNSSNVQFAQSLMLYIPSFNRLEDR